MDVDQQTLKHRLEFARAIALDAGRKTLEYFQANVGVDRKSDNTPVTIADREAEKLMRGRIESEFPNDAIVGEEYGEQSGTSGFRWILDPIDGTKSFITGVPLYGTLVGLDYNGQSVIGVIEIPALDQRVYGASGLGAFSQKGTMAPTVARVSDCANLSDAVYLTTEIRTFGDRNSLSAHTKIEEACWYSRTWGDCYGYYLIATGQADIMIDPAISIWDAAALLPVIEEAGGKFTCWKGVRTIEGQDAIATNGKLHDEVLRMLT